MNIVILDANTLTLDNDIDFSVFNQYGDVTIYQSSTDEEVGERIKDAEVVLCNKTVLNADKLSKAPNLKYIGLFATGYNNIDIDYTRAHSITVCNAGDYSTEAVAQHVFAFILHEYNTVDNYNTFVKNEGWVNAETFSPFFAMRELQGKTIGVIGYGSIGRKVADVARVFGMKVMAYSRSQEKKDPNFRILEYASIDDILANSDIVTMHCPLNEDSKYMCNKEFFKKMKKDALFINTSRGNVVDEEALAWALNNDIIAHAAVDVVSKEPMEKDNVLLKAKNIIITPHIAWAPIEARTRLIKIVSKNLQKWVAGTPINVIE